MPDSGLYVICLFQYDYTFQTKLMTVDGWPGACSPLHTVFQLIETAQKWQLENDIGPVIVVDRFVKLIAVISLSFDCKDLKGFLRNYLASAHHKLTFRSL